MRKKSAVRVANEKVPIATVLRLLNVDLPEDIESARSRKVSCPFGPVYHSDHGLSPAMRIYPDSNSAYCFSCTTYFTPVGLAARALDLDWRSAATRLLDHIGHRTLDLAGAWRDAVDFEPQPDKTLLADALKTFCRRTAPGWQEQQFEPAVAHALTRCLTILDLIRTAQDAGAWLSTCKVAMTRVLQEEQSLA